MDMLKYCADPAIRPVVLCLPEAAREVLYS